MPVWSGPNKKRLQKPPTRKPKRFGQSSSADPINKNLELVLNQFLDFLDAHEKHEKTKNREGAASGFGL